MFRNRSDRLRRGNMRLRLHVLIRIRKRLLSSRCVRRSSWRRRFHVNFHRIRRMIVIIMTSIRDHCNSGLSIIPESEFRFPDNAVESHQVRTVAQCHTTVSRAAVVAPGNLRGAPGAGGRPPLPVPPRSGLSSSSPGMPTSGTSGS